LDRPGSFGADIDYAMLHKIYGSPEGRDDERRYSPAVCTGIDLRPVTGNPDLSKASTSYVERQNLSMRMGMRRFTRLTNAFSKKVENLACAVSLHYMHYNFARPHQTLTKDNGGRKTTPAMAAGVTNRVWTCRDIARLSRVSWKLRWRSPARYLPCGRCRALMTVIVASLAGERK
jgi:hypothetical protein